MSLEKNSLGAREIPKESVFGDIHVKPSAFTREQADDVFKRTFPEFFPAEQKNGRVFKEFDIYETMGLDKKKIREAAVKKQDEYEARSEKLLAAEKSRFDRHDKGGRPNCYAAGVLDSPKNPITKREFDEKPSPGEIAGELFTYKDCNVLAYGSNEEVKTMLEQKIKKDTDALGMTFKEVPGGDHMPEKGNWLIAMVRATDTRQYSFGSEQDKRPDYHFYWKNDEGTWFHKRGDYMVENIDHSGRPILDPAKCDRGKYTDFLGYYEAGTGRGRAAEQYV